ncbi:MAG: hypothetical protein M3332_02590 [Actinomycetota bacterium]|nr:hypothetical protein [Actinomycetota bacterium]
MINSSSSQRADDPGEDGLDRDRRRAEALRALGPGSSQYVDFGLKLRDYGINTLMSQRDDLSAIVRQKTSIVLPPQPQCWTLRHIRSIVGTAVSRSVEPFLEAAILQGGWCPERRTRIKTYFVGRCYFAFADDYRREHHAEHEAVQDLQGRNLDLELDVARYVQRSVELDPEQTVINRAEIRRLLGQATHAQIPTIVFLLASGLTCGEVADHVQMTENAVNKALGKFRADITRAHRRTQ